MMKPVAVIDTSVLFRLARLHLLDKLFGIFLEVHVPRSVRREARLGGRQRRRRDVERFKRLMTPCDRWLPMVFAISLDVLRRRDPLGDHRGEAEMIAQAEVLDPIDVLLTDDRSATEFAEERGFEVWGTPRILVEFAAIPD